ncbi:hypothetical protein HYALB_00003200 [Hymenoscyphus albidus]|uniref:DUF1754-domain-containing protein n=1 Tax=Hymenoscyphus albidus TaxID=595503 RepID=A0A9N9Q156_9HELO|nr:hypothetical protein HYALB_00003200 [Hymenoscyphus albidus]
MPSDDYTPIVRGGLKLKGSSSAGIKKKKKKDKSKTSTGATKEEALTKAIENKDTEKTEKDDEDEVYRGEDGEELDLTTLEQRSANDGKTASERAYEENRRKRLQARLQREGPKTHKQRVENLNKYLSNLSEHHDMPRIGPG